MTRHSCIRWSFGVLVALLFSVAAKGQDFTFSTPTVWRPSEGNWYIINLNGTIRIQQWGVSGDIPVPRDYDGDSKSDLAVWRPSEGNWYIIKSSDGTTLIQQWGIGGDIPLVHRMLLIP